MSSDIQSGRLYHENNTQSGRLHHENNIQSGRLYHENNIQSGRLYHEQQIRIPPGSRTEVEVGEVLPEGRVEANSFPLLLFCVLT